MRIKTCSDEPVWLDADELAPNVPALKGVRVKVRPASPAMYLAARAAANETYRELDADVLAAATAGDKDGASPASDPADALKRASYRAAEAFAREFLTIGILAWEKVEDEKGVPLPATPVGIRQGLRSVALFDFLDEFYVAPYMTQDAEKNASSPSPNGIGGAKTPAKRIVATAKRSARTARTR